MKSFFKPFRSMLDDMEKTFGADPFKHSTDTIIRKSSISTSTIIQDGHKVEITTRNGETTIKVNNTEYVPKEDKK